MACYHPMAGVRDGYYESGAPKYRLVAMSDHCLDDFPREDVIQIPCGKCLGCRLDYAHSWQSRLLMELMCHDSAWFLTLTYDDDHCPKLEMETESGTLISLDNLRKKDFQDFIKRLRQHFPDDHIRYYIVGEYGEQTYRCHGHGIVFGLHLDDVVPKIGCKAVNGEQIYYSEKLEKIWENGYVELGTVTPESCSYVARYVTKKLKDGAKEELYSKGLEKEFAIMSRKPGIGRNYFDQYPNMFDNGKAYLALKNGSYEFTPPRYFKNLINDDNLKIKNYVISKINREEKLKLTNQKYLEMLKIKEKEISDKTKIFTRDSI